MDGSAGWRSRSRSAFRLRNFKKLGGYADKSLREPRLPQPYRQRQPFVNVPLKRSTQRFVEQDAMANLSLRQAAEHVGKSKSTIFRAIQAGRLSARKTDDGEFAIDPAELFRVYPPVKAAVPPAHSAQQSVGHDATPAETVVRIAELETEVRLLRELLTEVKANRDELRAERDDWRSRAERLLTDQRTTIAPAPRPKPAPRATPKPPPAPASSDGTPDGYVTNLTSLDEIRRRIEAKLAARAKEEAEEDARAAREREAG